MIRQEVLDDGTKSGHSYVSCNAAWLWLIITATWLLAKQKNTRMLLFTDVQSVHSLKCYQCNTEIHLHNFLKSIEETQQCQDKLIVPHDATTCLLQSQKWKQCTIYPVCVTLEPHYCNLVQAGLQAWLWWFGLRSSNAENVSYFAF